MPVRLLPILVPGLLPLALWIDTSSCPDPELAMSRTTLFSVYLSVLVPPVVNAVAL